MANKSRKERFVFSWSLVLWCNNRDLGSAGSGWHWTTFANQCPYTCHSREDYFFARLGFYDHRNWILGDKPRTLSRWPLFDAILILSIPSCHLKKKREKKITRFESLFSFFLFHLLFLFVNSFVRFIPICTRIKTKRRRKLSMAMDTYLIFEIKQKLFYTLVWQMSTITRSHAYITFIKVLKKKKKERKKESVRDKWEQSGMPSI